MDVNAQTRERVGRVAGQRLWKPRKQPGAGLDQHHMGLLGIDGAEVGGKRLAREFRHGSRHLHPGRPTADDNDAQEPAALLGVALKLGALESQEQTAADLRCVVDRLQARRMGGPVVVAEIAVGRPGREHENVVADPAIA